MAKIPVCTGTTDNGAHEGANGQSEGEIKPPLQNDDCLGGGDNRWGSIEVGPVLSDFSEAADPRAEVHDELCLYEAQKKLIL
jgi:hypothetical protein